MSRPLFNRLEIKKRYYHLKPFKQCFVGAEAVTWVENSLSLSRKDAVQLLRTMMVRSGRNRESLLLV